MTIFIHSSCDLRSRQDDCLYQRPGLQTGLEGHSERPRRHLDGLQGGGGIQAGTIRTFHELVETTA